MMKHLDSGSFEAAVSGIINGWPKHAFFKKRGQNHYKHPKFQKHKSSKEYTRRLTLESFK